MQDNPSNFMVTTGRVFRMGLLSFWRNRLLTLATTIIIVLALFIISVFAFATSVANRTAAILRDKVDLVVYLKDSASEDQINALKDIIGSRLETKSIKFVSKDEALERWKTNHADNQDLATVISETENPLPRSFEVKTNLPEEIKTLADYVNSEDYAPLIEKISYEQTKNLVERLVKITKFVKVVGWSLSLLFVLISILIVYNTLRLTIYSRSDEIEIMKLVGASDYFVRGPFVVEGISYGLSGAIIAIVIFYFFFKFSIPFAQNYLEVQDLKDSLEVNLWLIIGMQVVIGVILGALCSLMAAKKYLMITEKK